MKKIFTTAFLATASLIAASAQSEVVLATDSVVTREIEEIVVNADGQIETAEKVVLLPKALEKKHASNAFDLLSVMQTPDLAVDPQSRSISTHYGGQVVVLINGVEALPEDVATLNSKNISNIEYVRTPSGKYAGKAGLVNFVTIKLEYGGNVYVSANEGFAYKMGDYIAFTDFTKNDWTFSLTASADWERNHNYTEGHEAFTFADGTSLTRDLTSKSALSKSNNQSYRFRLQHIGENHRLNTYVSFTRQASPKADVATEIAYAGGYEGSTERRTSADSKDLAPFVYANYTLWLPKDQTLDISAIGSVGRNKYNSTYGETGQADITSAVTEDNNYVVGNARYYKWLSNGMTLSASVDHTHNYYKDSYSGTAASEQRLQTEVSTAVLQLSASAEKYYYYVSAGVSNTAVSLNDEDYNYCVPIAFYGGNLAFNEKNSVSLNGLFTHTLFSPTDKNSVTLPTSFFEAEKGNPDLSPLKALGNTLSYNGQYGKSMLSLSYSSNIYFDNILHVYSADDATIYDTRSNDGTFYGNMLTATYTFKACKDKLRLSLTGLEEYNIIRGDTYDMERNVLRAKASVTYLTGDWMFRVNYNTPHKALDIREPYTVRTEALYELIVGWNRGCWGVEAFVHNPFDRYDERHVTMDYGCYARDTRSFNESKGRNVNLKVTYTFGYGKKKEMGDVEIERRVNSAIMRGR